eukprot:SM000117S25475  [mRNA]  locus=s117:507:4208:- [translate_table: standard]
MARVSVCVRFRPPSRREKAEDQRSCVQRASNESFAWKNDREGNLSFTFNRIFYPDAQQAEVFDYVAEPIVRGAFVGINGSILAYGQGPNQGPRVSLGHPDDGILPRLAKAIFAAIRTADPKVEFVIKLAMVTPVAHEKHTRLVPEHAPRDLLDTDKDNLLIKEGKDEGIYIAGATEAFVQTESEMQKLLQAGIINRAVAATDMNEESSRSHCVYMVTIQQESIDDRSVRVGKLHFVDLAGSEKVVKSSANGHLVDEAKTINKSLSALGNVINALTDGRKLSDLPALLLLSQQLQRCRDTLHFAIWAAEVKNEPTVNEQRPSGTLQQQLDKAVEECNVLRAQLLNLSIHKSQPESREITKQPSIVIVNKTIFACVQAMVQILGAPAQQERPQPEEHLYGNSSHDLATELEILDENSARSLHALIEASSTADPQRRANTSLLSRVEKAVDAWNLDLSA